MRPAKPCLGCGELTHRAIDQEEPGGGLRRIPLCLHCIRIWQVNSLCRHLLLTTRRSWGSETIRRLLEPPAPLAEPPREPPYEPSVPRRRIASA